MTNRADLRLQQQCLLTALVLVVLTAAPAGAQVAMRACYVPDLGLVYRIGETGLPTACQDPTHVEFSWNEQGPEGPAGADGAVGSAGAQGATGATGPTGAAGVFDFELIQTTFTGLTGDVVRLADCTGSKVALGGGWHSTDPNSVRAKEARIFSGDGEGFAVSIAYTNEGSYDLTVQVTCATPVSN